MKKQLITYETLVKITSAISATRDPEEVVVLTVESVKTAMDVKGCTLFLIDRKTEELKIAGSYGLSQNYLDKGPVSSLTSIAESLKEGPVAIYDVSDDPRLQYPEEAKKDFDKIHEIADKIENGSIGVVKSWGGMHLCCTLDQIKRFRKSSADNKTRMGSGCRPVPALFRSSPGSGPRGRACPSPA